MFRLYALLAALSGFLAVAIGAFATHGITDLHARELIDTGARYQFLHTFAMLAGLMFWRSWGAARARHAPGLFLSGIVLFCGSLYGLAFGAPRAVGAITPIGGLLFLAGWAVLAWAALALKDSRQDASA
jgi:uncharacterized membrane protein YgdD (TMEM256/DUF423 family)